MLNPRRSRLPGIPAEAGAVGAVSRGERACSLPVTRTRVRAGVAPRGCPVREGVERVVSVFLRDGVDASRPSSLFDVDGRAAVGVGVAGEIGV